MGIFDESYSSVELSRILGIHRVTVTNWIKAGALKAVQTPGGRYKVTKESLKTFLTERGMPVPPALRLEDKKLVVAVDDEKPVLNTLKKMFSRGEMPFLYDLKTFDNPLEAALFIGNEKPDLVLLDLLMPQLSGFNLAEKIKETCPNTRIVVITGHPTEENRAKLKAYGINNIVNKPFTFDVLRKAIEDGIESE